jgi:prepilin-type processing-associated H-X9-DG protein
MPAGCDTTFSAACATKASDIDLVIGSSLTGIIGIRSEVKLKQVLDGTSNTILAGEKFLRPKYYESGIGLAADGKGNPGDNSACYQGYDWDNARFPAGNRLPTQDTDDEAVGSDQRSYGSAHSAGINLVYVDGSVQGVNYEIDPEVWNLMGGRDDGK